MSKVKIQGNASGAGVFTVIAPAGNTDRTLSLPDNAGTILTSASSLASANLSGRVPAANAPSGSVIQVVESVRSSALSFTSGFPSFTEYISGSITTTVTNSKIMILANIPIYQIGSGTWGISSYHRLSENGTAISGYEHPGPQTGAEMSAIWSFNFLTQAKSIGTYTYAMSAARTEGSGTISIARVTGGFASTARLFLMEIAA